MIEEVAKAGLSVNENIVIKKNRYVGSDNKNPSGKRVCVVTGIHGDELEGQYVCAKLADVLQNNLAMLNGTVDIYPALNPLGIDSITRGIPLFDLDMNRIFPGTNDGTMAECLASDIISDISGADICIDIHSSNIYLREIPQVRINEMTADELIPYAKMLGCDFIWVHASATVLESTLAYSLNSIGTKNACRGNGGRNEDYLRIRRQADRRNFEPSEKPRNVERRLQTRKRTYHFRRQGGWICKFGSGGDIYSDGKTLVAY